jgi:hypothetical protein
VGGAPPNSNTNYLHIYWDYSINPCYFFGFFGLGMGSSLAVA